MLRNVFGAMARVSSAMQVRRVEARGLRVKRKEENKRVESVLKKSETGILAMKVSKYVQDGRRGRRQQCQHRGVERETGTSGERTGCCQCGRVQLQSSLDVFGKDELW
jgi:hypothetical protein